MLFDVFVALIIVPGCLVIGLGAVGVAVEIASDIWGYFFPNYDDAYDPERFK